MLVVVVLQRENMVLMIEVDREFVFVTGLKVSGGGRGEASDDIYAVTVAIVVFFFLRLLLISISLEAFGALALDSSVEDWQRLFGTLEVAQTFQYPFNEGVYLKITSGILLQLKVYIP